MDTGNTAEFIYRGLSLMSEGKYRQTYDKAIARIKADTQDPAAYFVLGKMSADHNNTTKALELFEKAASLGPNNLYCQAYYAQVLTLTGQQIAAKQRADIAALLPDADDHIADILGVIYSRTGFHELAIPWFQRAVLAKPNCASYQYNLGASFQFTGEFSAAERAFTAALQLEPEHYRAQASLVQLSKQTPHNNRVQKLEAAFERAASDPDAQLHLGHALAKSLEDLGDYPTSLKWLAKAKQGKRTETSPIGYDALIEQLKTLPMTKGHSTNPEAPIFIVGLPRTGTTLVDRIIGSHSAVVSAGELNVFASLVKQAAGTASNLTLDTDTLQAASMFTAAQLQDLGLQYSRMTEPLRRGATRFTDKMPLNFLYCGLIHQAFPNARIIALRRNPMDSCLSNYRQLLTTQQAYYAYTFDLEATAQFYCRFDDLMAHWRLQLPQDRFLEVRYEDIVFQQTRETERLLGFCGLDWEDACLNFHENEAPVSTASSVQVRQPLYSGSIGRWQRYGNELAGLERYLRERGIDVMEGLPNTPQTNHHGT